MRYISIFQGNSKFFQADTSLKKILDIVKCVQKWAVNKRLTAFFISGRTKQKGKGSYMNISEEARKEAKRAYEREWRRKHPDRVKQYRKKFWEKKAAEFLSGSQQ